MRRLPEWMPYIPQHWWLYLRRCLFRPDRLGYFTTLSRIKRIQSPELSILSLRKMYRSVPVKNSAPRVIALQPSRNSTKGLHKNIMEIHHVRMEKGDA